MISFQPVILPYLERTKYLCCWPTRIGFLTLTPSQMNPGYTAIGQRIKCIVSVKPTGNERRIDLKQRMTWADFPNQLCFPSQQIRLIHRGPYVLPRLKPFQEITPVNLMVM